MLRNAPLLRRGVLLIRGPAQKNESVGPGSAARRKMRCTASGTRALLTPARSIPPSRILPRVDERRRHRWFRTGAGRGGIAARLVAAVGSPFRISPRDLQRSRNLI